MAAATKVKVTDDRVSWKIGSKVEVYSSSLNTWYGAEITKIFIDDEGEWLEAEYTVDNIVRVKQVSRDDNEMIRSFQPKITLNIKNVFLNEKYTINVLNNCNVYNLKEEIQNKSPDNIHIALQKLMYKGIQLKDNKQIINEKPLQIKDNHTIIIVKQQNKNINIKINRKNKIFNLQINSINNIFEIKQLIHNKLKFGKKPNLLKLIFNDKVLDDNQLFVTSLGIKENDIITVKVKKPVVLDNDNDDDDLKEIGDDYSEGNNANISAEVKNKCKKRWKNLLVFGYIRINFKRENNKLFNNLINNLIFNYYYIRFNGIYLNDPILYLKSLSSISGKKDVIKYIPNYKIKDLINEYCLRNGIIFNIKLMWNGIQLDKSRTISDYKIKENNTIFVVISDREMNSELDFGLGFSIKLTNYNQNLIFSDYLNKNLKSIYDLKKEIFKKI